MMNRYQLTSVIFHLITLLTATIALQPYLASKQLGEPQLDVIHAYIQSETHTTDPIQHVTRPEKKIKLKPKKPMTQLVKHQQSLTQTNNVSVSTNQKAHGEQVDELLRLLHRVIQEVQRYPKSAEVMGREGRATVAFKLLMNGDVTNVELQQSSGTPSLDEAALLAVKSAAPFHGVERFLSEPRTFAIDVVFALS